MGIANLLQFLRQMQKCVNIKNYPGTVVAVDAMCWIHRGMISSAVANVTGEACDKYLKFIISMIALLLSYNITPIMGKSRQKSENCRGNRSFAGEKATSSFIAEGLPEFLYIFKRAPKEGGYLSDSPSLGDHLPWGSSEIQLQQERKILHTTLSKTSDP